jgi:SNF2 family DNA or RNA helicase
MQIIDNKSLLLKLREPNKVTSVIPSSRKISDHEVMVKWGLEQVQTLNKLNINVPSPIQALYQWPGKHKPFKHQISTASFLTKNKKAFCFNEQGTGKTASAIWASDYLLDLGVINRVLVICPLSIMDSAWRDDLFTFAPHRSVSVAHGASDKRTKIIEVRDTATDIVYRALQPAIRFTKEQCLDLPDMVYTKRMVELTAQQKKYYKKLKDQMIMEITGEQITAVNSAVSMNKLLQISAGAVYTDDGSVLEFDTKNRYRVLREVIDESSQKVLVFVPFKHVIDILSDKLRSEGLSTEIIRGDVPAHRRTDRFKKFQTTDDPQVLIIQPQAAAHGVTLTRANTVVWWGPTSSLETYEQANARVHRSGQKHKTTVVQLQGSNAERHVYRLLDNRIDVHTKLIDLYKEILD